MDEKNRRKEVADAKLAARLVQNAYKVHIKEVVTNRYSNELKKYFNDFSTSFDKYKKLKSTKGKEAALRKSLIQYLNIKCYIRNKQRTSIDTVHHWSFDTIRSFCDKKFFFKNSI